MDKILIKDFEVFANHGVFQEEKNLGQIFIISLELEVDTREAAKTGDLTKSVHYGELAYKVEAEFTRKSVDLIETAAEEIAEFILFNYPLVKGVKVNLKKPWAPVRRHLDYVAVEIERGWHKAYIALGSNIGEKNKNLDEAISKIESIKEIRVTKKSTLIETEPWGYLEQDGFVNGVIEIDTIFSPKELIRVLLNIEKEMKRERVIKWGPRIIDLDVIFYDDFISSDEEIILPHPRMELRDFVLKPMNEIAPYMLHPVLNKRIFQLLDELEKKL